MSDLRCLTGRQPWWWAILHAGKRIENRRKRWKYRGPILLHAAKGCTKDEYYGAVAGMLEAGVLRHPDFAEDAHCIDPGCHLSERGTHRAHVRVPTLADMPRSGIVGYAEILGVIEPQTAPKTIEWNWPGLDPRWHMPEQYGYVLGNVTQMPFVPCDGMLGLYRPSKPLLLKIQEAWAGDWLTRAMSVAVAAGVVFK